MDDPTIKLSIAPDTNIGALLEARPDLKGKVLELLPSLARLTTPALLNTVARTLTLEEAATASRVSLSDIVRRLREAAGLSDQPEESGLPSSAPDWVKAGKVTKTIDARPMVAQGQHPKDLVLKAFGELGRGEMLLLVAPSVPGPLIELGKGAGMQVWTRQGESGRFETYFGCAD